LAALFPIAKTEKSRIHESANFAAELHSDLDRPFDARVIRFNASAPGAPLL
jgi:hypothetical protein